jgi:hypothetical protein
MELRNVGQPLLIWGGGLEAILKVQNRWSTSPKRSALQAGTNRMRHVGDPYARFKIFTLGHFRALLPTAVCNFRIPAVEFGAGGTACR